MNNNLKVDESLKQQYTGVHERPVGSLSPEKPAPPPEAPQLDASPEVIKLFDDE